MALAGLTVVLHVGISFIRVHEPALAARVKRVICFRLKSCAEANASQLIHLTQTE